MMLRLIFILPFFLSGLVACSQDTASTNSKSVTELQVVKTVAEVSPPQSKTIVASIGDQRISLQELDTAIQFTLFDLEWRKYQLRKDMLNRMIAQRLQLFSEDSSEALISEILLSPPPPPRIQLPSDKRPIKGERDAIILMSVFCSYQSSHCARLQTVIKQLEEHYGKTIAFNFYDLPQGFHRYGVAAANAYHCAEAAGSPWAYQSALYSDVSKLDKQRFMNIAEQLNFDLINFEHCLDESSYQATIKSDMDMANKMGLGSVPVIFINGLYTKGAQSFEAYRFYIDQELAQLGYDFKSAEEQTPTESQLPILLLATTVSSHATGNENTSIALVKLPESEQEANYKEGDFIFENVQLVKIETQRILIDNQGALEFVVLQSSMGHDLDDIASDISTQQEPVKASDSEPSYDDEALAEEMKRREIPATGEMVLSKEWLESQLINQGELEQHFYNADHVVEGHHLIKLNEIVDQRFYNTLGFKTGDVLLRVNDQWVHSGQNPLWDSLAKEEKVTVMIMRGGYPVRYDYNIK